MDLAPSISRPDEFAVTFDYRCPFARNLHEHLVTALEAGAPWRINFLGFSLNQVHVAPGEQDVWGDPARRPDLLAMQVGIAVRDRWPERFLSVHRALFAARHDGGKDLRDEDVLRGVLAEHGVAGTEVMEEVAGGAPLETFRKEHEQAVRDHAVFGVPTVIVGNDSVFIRVMHRPNGDPGAAMTTVGRVLDLVAGWPELNELKHTTVPR